MRPLFPVFKHLNFAGATAKKETVKDFETICQNIYRRLRPEFIHACFVSWPDRRDALIEARGGPIKW